MGNYRLKSVPRLRALSFEYLLHVSQTKLDNLSDYNHPFKTEQPQQSVLQVYSVTVKVIAGLKSAPQYKIRVCIQPVFERNDRRMGFVL